MMFWSTSTAAYQSFVQSVDNSINENVSSHNVSSTKFSSGTVDEITRRAA